MDKLIMTPAPGERLLRFVGDRIRFGLRTPQGFARGWKALLRTNLGKAERLRQEMIVTHAGKNPRRRRALCYPYFCECLCRSIGVFRDGSPFAQRCFA